MSSFSKNKVLRNAKVLAGLKNGLSVHLSDGSAAFKNGNKRKNNNNQMNNEDSFEDILDNSSSNKRLMMIENNNDLNDMVESRNDDSMMIVNDDVFDTFGIEEFKEDIEEIEDIDEDKDCESIDSLNIDEQFVDDTVDSVKSTNFNSIKDNILNVLYEIKCKKIPEDYNDPLLLRNIPVFNDGYTKGQFAEQLIHWFISSEVSILDRIGLLDILHTFVPQLNIPIAISYKNNLISKLDKYIIFKIPVLTYDLCINGCMVFDGFQINDKECSKCHSKRYKPCTKGTCKDKQNLELCSEEYTNICNHSISEAFQSVCYRPILAIVLNLLSYPSFRKLIQFSYSDIFTNNININTLDITTSKIYKKNMEEMNTTYNKFMNLNTQKNRNIVPINICIAQNYDGCQIHKTKTSVFYPLLMTILNLPPTHRFKLGMGMFALSIYSCTSKSAGENFLFEKLFVEELLMLEKGVEYEVDNIQYFIQVRLILNIFDSKAIEEHLHVQASGSHAGCPFCKTAGEGTTVSELGKVVFIGSRKLLDKKHYLRYFGQSRICCPNGFYKIQINSENIPIVNTPLNLSVSKYRKSIQRLDNCISGFNSSADFLEFYNSALHDSRNWVWHHEKYPGVLFIKYLYYFHCDLRSQEKQVRKNSLEYKNDAKQAKLDRRPYHGVKGEWNEAKLSYIRFEENINYDPFHTIMLLSKSTLQHWKGERFNSIKMRHFCESYNIHPCVNDGTNYLWKINPNAQLKVLFFF
jgi:hypothetical protein